ncbi:hypothetical protein KC316_g56 [Hortaea werneckii]|nr:hypothetical protein KC316_g56 [Hortaea werneckii]
MGEDVRACLPERCSGCFGAAAGAYMVRWLETCERRNRLYSIEYLSCVHTMFIQWRSFEIHLSGHLNQAFESHLNCGLKLR